MGRPTETTTPTKEKRSDRWPGLRIISIVVAVIVFCGLAFAIFHPREPRYQGRTLSEWILNDIGNNVSGPAHQAAERAVKDIGSNAIPWLLKWAEQHDSSLKLRAIDFLNEHTAIHLKVKPAAEYHYIAFQGLRLLGIEAKPAWPVLIQWTYSPNEYRQYLAINFLEACTPDKATFLPVLLRKFHDSSDNVQRIAASYLHYNYPKDAEAAGVYKMFPEMRKWSTSGTNLNEIPLN